MGDESSASEAEAMNLADDSNPSPNSETSSESQDRRPIVDEEGGPENSATDYSEISNSSHRTPVGESDYMASDSSDGDTMSRNVQRSVENLSIQGDDAVAAEEALVDAQVVDYTPLLDDPELDNGLNPDRLKYSEPLIEKIKEAYKEITRELPSGVLRLGLKQSILAVVFMNLKRRPEDDKDFHGGFFSPTKKRRIDEDYGEDCWSGRVTRSGSKSASIESPSKLTTHSKTESSGKESPSKSSAHFNESAEKGSQMDSLPGSSKTSSGVVFPTGDSPSSDCPILRGALNKEPLMEPLPLAAVIVKGQFCLKPATSPKKEPSLLKGALEGKSKLEMMIAPLKKNVGELKELFRTYLGQLSAMKILTFLDAQEKEDIFLKKSSTDFQGLNAELVFAEKLLAYEEMAGSLLLKCMASTNNAYSYDIFSDPLAESKLSVLCEEIVTLKKDIKNLQDDYSKFVRSSQLRSGNALHAQLYVSFLLGKISELVKSLDTKYVEYLLIHKDFTNKVEECAPTG